MIIGIQITQANNDALKNSFWLLDLCKIRLSGRANCAG
jgi:autonomous glycyl radical cofactor GrcA